MTTFKKTRLASSMSLVLGALITSPVQAQENDNEIEAGNFEVIEVSGIRESLTKAMLTKKAASGVVDAISAEDIGKFPDTNLAESLQRITGVSIDRSQGEGSRITVRGFGPDYNLVTLNGRQMPAANIAATSASSIKDDDDIVDVVVIFVCCFRCCCFCCAVSSTCFFFISICT